MNYSLSLKSPIEFSVMSFCKTKTKVLTLDASFPENKTSIYQSLLLYDQVRLLLSIRSSFQSLAGPTQYTIVREVLKK